MATRRRRPEVPPEDPQRAVNRLWERWLARKYPGTSWEIVRIGEEDGDDATDGQTERG